MEHQKPTLSVQEINDLIVLQMGGEINAATLGESRKLIDDFVEKYQINKRENLRILVDYQNVTDVDSSTVANILDRINEQEGLNHTVAFVHVPDELKSLVEIYKLEKKVLIFETEEAAIKKLTEES